ncbi:MAG TPA: hypothetical protein VIM25_02010 [Candidatus Limnocylindrales bacterium]
MGRIAHRVPVGVEADAQLETEHRSHLGSKLDRQLPWFPSLGPPDLRVRNADLACEFALADGRAASSCEQLGCNSAHEESAAPDAAIDRAFVKRHGSMMEAATYFGLIAESVARWVA